MLARELRYDVVTFMSVLHEFYTYGEGTSSVVKALSDAHEILKNNGRIILRDMILPEYLKSSGLYLDEIKKNIESSEYAKELAEFKLLDMRIIYEECYTIEYLNNKWKADFNLSDDQVSAFRTTTILVAKK